MWINQNENIQFIFNFTGNLSTHEPHAKDHPHSHPSDTPRTQTYQAMFLSISPLLNVFLSAAERSHNCIKSDVYDCRFDFSTHQYLLAASSSLPSAVPHFCLYLTMLHLVYLPAGLLVDTCVGQLFFLLGDFAGSLSRWNIPYLSWFVNWPQSIWKFGIIIFDLCINQVDRILCVFSECTYEHDKLPNWLRGEHTV